MREKGHEIYSSLIALAFAVFGLKEAGITFLKRMETVYLVAPAVIRVSHDIFDWRMY